MELKVLVRSRPETPLSPATITDRDVVLAYDDGLSHHTLFALWFDDLWAATPGRHQIFGRGVLNQEAVDEIRQELEAAETATRRRTA